MHSKLGFDLLRCHESEYLIRMSDCLPILFKLKFQNNSDVWIPMQILTKINFTIVQIILFNI